MSDSTTAVYTAAELATMDHSSRGYVVILTTTLCLTISGALVAARLYTRTRILKGLGADDYASVIAWLVVLVFGVVAGIQVRDGIGRHSYDLSSDPEVTITLLKESLWNTILYNFAIFCTKLVFLFQYYRLVKGILKLRIVYAVVMGLVVAWSVAQILLTVLACIPISALWDSEVMKTAKCNSLGGAGQMWMTTVGSIVCDIIILVLPFPVVRKLQLPKTQKWFLFGIFSLGLVTCVVTSFRAVILSNSFMDLSWDSMGVVCITIAEPSSGLICAAIPTLRPLFIKIFPSMASQRSHTSTYRMYDYDSRTKPTLSSGVMNNYTRSPNDEIEFEDRASQKDLVKDIETGR